MSTEARAEAPAPAPREQLERVPGVLGRIALERHGDYDGRPAQAAGSTPAGRSGALTAALAQPSLGVIAEVKRASPSQGTIADLDPVATARAYEAAGAVALSVLTEPRHFGGELAHLQAIAGTVGVPLLRKDFTVHPAQVVEAAAAGAAAVLLIVAVLDELTADYLHFATAMGLDALVEVHDERELEIALAAGAGIVGVNNRDLRTLHIDLDTAPRLMAAARSRGYGGLLVAESGYSGAAQLAGLEGLADAVLIGTSLAGSGDPGAALAALVSAGRN